MDRLQIEIVSSAELKPSLQDEITHWLIAVFLDEDDDTAWASVDWHILGWIDDELVGHVDVLRRLVLVREVKVTVAGIGGVVTKATWRGKGLGSRLMREAQRFMREGMAVDFGLLMCDQAMISFYESLGWHVVDGPLLYHQPSGQELFEDAVMVYPITEAEFPEGEIDVQGYPW